MTNFDVGVEFDTWQKNLSMTPPLKFNHHATTPRAEILANLGFSAGIHPPRRYRRNVMDLMISILTLTGLYRITFLQRLGMMFDLF